MDLQELEGLRAEIEALWVNNREMSRRVRELEEHVDTVSSALWKRMIWWCQGYYFRKVGRWYGN